MQNKHWELKNYIRDILKKNISYIFLLPLYDMLPLYYKATSGKNLAISLYQYLALFGVYDSYLIHNGIKNYIWIKANKIPKSNIKNVISQNDIDPKNLIQMLNTLFVSSNVLVIEKTDKYIIGMPLIQNLEKDIQLIQQGRYTEVSDEYKKRLTFRSRSIYFDGSLEAMITKHAIAYNVCDKTSKMKEFFETYFGTKIENENVFKKMVMENEISCEEN